MHLYCLDVTLVALSGYRSPTTWWVVHVIADSLLDSGLSYCSGELGDRVVYQNQFTIYIYTMVLAMEQATLAFTRALHRFQAGLTDEELSQFKFTTIDDVWDAARYLQREQSSRFSMRNMGRLAPFINGLSRYSSVIEVFVQAKPDIMAFIWVGPRPHTGIPSVFFASKSTS